MILKKIANKKVSYLPENKKEELLSSIMVIPFPSRMDTEVLKFLRTAKTSSSAQIANHFGIPHTSMSSTIARMLEKGLIENSGVGKGRKGEERLLKVTDIGNVAIELLESKKYKRVSAIIPV